MSQQYLKIASPASRVGEHLIPVCNRGEWALSLSTGVCDRSMDDKLQLYVAARDVRQACSTLAEICSVFCSQVGTRQIRTRNRIRVRIRDDHTNERRDPYPRTSLPTTWLKDGGKSAA